jgi:phospholipid/cholesterol/gamma-HCH transport system permease protein
MAFTATFDEGRGTLRLDGPCRMTDTGQLERALGQCDAFRGRQLGLQFNDAVQGDIGPAWLVRQAIDRLEARGVQVAVSGDPPEHFPYLEKLVQASAASGSAASTATLSPLRRFGRWVEKEWHATYESLTFGGQALLTAAGIFGSFKRLRLPSIVRHAYETGLQAIPVVGVIAFLISVISAYIGAQQLRPFGGEIFTVDIVAIGVLRELGVLLTAIMVAGRTGSAYAAELGVMKLNDEVDALESMGINPYEVLVVPRVLGLVIALPLLTIVADAMGLLGGALLTRTLIDLPWPQFVQRLDAAIGATTFWAGLVKAPVFAVLIGLTGTLRGLQVRESSRELGRLTTVAVVQSIFLVIFADALFAIFFLHIDF